MDNQTKTIVVLLVLILILSIFFGLKIIGKKSSQYTEVKTEENIISEQKPDLELKQHENWNKKEPKKNFFAENLYTLYFYIKTYVVIIFIISIIINIGIAKMYRKIGMPTWTITLQLISPLLLFINIPFVNLVIEILQFAALVVLYQTLDAFRIELGKKFMGISAIALVIVLFVSKFNMINIVTNMALLVGVVFTLILLMLYIKMSLNLGKEFEKGLGFKLGLILLPIIFQPILGYQKD